MEWMVVILIFTRSCWRWQGANAKRVRVRLRAFARTYFQVAGKPSHWGIGVAEQSRLALWVRAFRAQGRGDDYRPLCGQCGRAMRRHHSIAMPCHCYELR